jgi:uridine kinase
VGEDPRVGLLVERREVLRQLANHIVSLHCPHPLRVAIDGIDAAGKTTLADQLARPIEERGWDVIRASIDGFHPECARLVLPRMAEP